MSSDRPVHTSTLVLMQCVNQAVCRQLALDAVRVEVGGRLVSSMSVVCGTLRANQCRYQWFGQRVSAVLPHDCVNRLKASHRKVRGTTLNAINAQVPVLAGMLS